MVTAADALSGSLVKEVWPMPRGRGIVQRAPPARSLAVPYPRPRVTCFAAPVSLGLPRPTDDEPAIFKPLPKRVENLADDPQLANPLQRLQRLGTGWLGVILELEGACVDFEYGDVGKHAWRQLAQEESKAVPPQWLLKKADGMKNEQVIQEVFCWSRNPVEVRRLASSKEKILTDFLGERKPMLTSGLLQLLEILKRCEVPTALVCSAPERRVLKTLEEAGLDGCFDTVVTGDDVYRGRPDPEGYLYAAQRMGRPPLRCVVVGASNMTVEAAHEVGMKCVAVAGQQPMYELTAADLVVRSLSELTFLNLKKLFSMEETVLPHGEDEDSLQMEREEQEESSGPSVHVQALDFW